MIQRLDSKEFVRLMYVGQLKNLCAFENPSTEMHNDAALDYSMGLVKIENNAVTRDSVRAELTKVVAQGKTLDNGYPRTCYDMTLTDDGYNVKTALVDNFQHGIQRCGLRPAVRFLREGINQSGEAVTKRGLLG